MSWLNKDQHLSHGPGAAERIKAQLQGKLLGRNGSNSRCLSRDRSRRVRRQSPRSPPAAPELGCYPSQLAVARSWDQPVLMCDQSRPQAQLLTPSRWARAISGRSCLKIKNPRSAGQSQLIGARVEGSQQESLISPRLIQTGLVSCQTKLGPASQSTLGAVITPELQRVAPDRAEVQAWVAAAVGSSTFLTATDRRDFWLAPVLRCSTPTLTALSILLNAAFMVL